MRSPRITRPHTVTVFIKNPENSERKVTYRKVVIEQVRALEKFESIEDDNGKRRENTLGVTIDMNDFKATEDGKTLTYIDGRKYDALQSAEEDVSNYVTFRPKTDLAMFGTTDKSTYNEVKKETELFLVQSCRPQRATNNKIQYLNLQCYE